MKKIVWSVVALLAMASPSLAQDKKGYIGISLGPSIPLGDLASKDIDNESAGFATSGAIFDISVAYKLGKGPFGITAMLRGQANPMDAKAFVDGIANQNPGIYWTVESEGWSAGGWMLGGFGSFSISPKASFEPRAMIGFVNAVSPNITITGSANGSSIWVKQGTSSVFTFSYLLGAGFKFDLGQKFYLLTNLDYLGSNPEFSNIDITASDGSRSKSTVSQPMGTLNWGLGVALKI